MQQNTIIKRNSILSAMVGFNLEERRLLTFCLQHYNSMKDADNSNISVIVSYENVIETYPSLKNKKPSYIFRIFKEACTSLQTKPFTPPESPLEAKYWFDSIKVLESGGFQFTLTKSIEPYFLNISKHFIRYKVGDIAHFNRKSSWNIYEYLKEKFLDGKCKEWKVEVEDLKERLGVADKYIKRFNKFEEICLKNPLLEINNGSDICVKYTKIKRGKTPFEIAFFVEKTKWQDIDVLQGETSSEAVKNALLEVGLKTKFIDSLIKEADEKNILIHLEKKLPVILKGAKEPKVRNAKAYITASLNNVLKGQSQPSLFNENIPKLTVEACLKNKGKNCAHRKDLNLKPLYETLCPDCRKLNI